jgi:UDP-N-acetylmuramyl tripeptide synthase
MARPSRAKIALARLAGRLARISGSGGTSAPGKVLLRLDRHAVRALGERLPRGSVLVSATNGKTTTAAMAAAILESQGIGLVHNQAGANMTGGIASTLLAAARAEGGIDGEMGLFEVDEMWLPAVVAELEPRALVLGNLLRDQLDRYGELDTISERWAETVSNGPGAGARLVLCADDPVVADLGHDRAEVFYFGLEDDSLALPRMSHAADAKHCRRCGAPYVFDAIYLAHLGRYRCPACGRERPRPQVYATDVELEGIRAARFRLHTPHGEAPVALPLPGLYNVYNALGAAALASSLEVPPSAIAAALEGMQAAFGRAESTVVDGRELRILLVKNPVGATEVLRTLALEGGEQDLLAVLNDQIADGRDVSWIWDADFELLGGAIRRVTCSGTRAAELALRMKYAGVDSERVVLEPDLSAALARALADRPDGAAAPLYALPTYTAMLALRKLLGKGGRRLGSAT